MFDAEDDNAVDGLHVQAWACCGHVLKPGTAAAQRHQLGTDCSVLAGAVSQRCPVVAQPFLQ